MSAKSILPAGAPPPIAPYSPGTLADNVLYVSGTLALNASGACVGDGDVRAQTIRVLDSIRDVLRTAGGDLSNVVYTMIFLKRREDYATMNSVYAQYFPASPPARYCIICELVRPEFLVEIGAIAHLAK